MPRLKAKLEVTGIAAIPRSQLRDAFREGIRAAGVYWWTNYCPLHFLPSNRARYHGKARKQYYIDKKAARAEIADVRAIGETQDLVWSGRSRELATKTQNIQAIATSADEVRCDVIMNAPALNFRYKGSQINMQDELRTILPGEEAQLQQIYITQSQVELERMGNSARITRTVAA